jgi:V-type H+-transporting ATPase subunit F
MSKSKKFNRNENNLLIGIIGDEETVTGFLLAGIGERNENFSNFLKVTSETDTNQIRDYFQELVSNKKIGIILISQDVAERIRETLDAYDEIIPTVLEIPSKNTPYSIEKDSIMQKALRQLYGQNIPDDLK